MSDIVIKAENLGKKYTIGHQAENGRYTALRDVLMQNARSLWNKTRDLVHGKPIIQGDTLEEVWALKHLSFEIGRGEAVGIIGRNGAGKSTLLKILSRITEPSAGRVTIKGRVASLLEVGTGFHPELTGRENIYLNGAILGMTRHEIKRKFCEIVAFAEVEKFLDTPVKRYSSGMYVRLAFAVAAHLEPDILIVDEVLAVGDAEFQKKCLGRMRNVSGMGRTVLFVSHNMAAIQNLCNKAIYLQKGEIQMIGHSDKVISNYLKSGSEIRSIDLAERKDRRGSGLIRFDSVVLKDSEGNSLQALQCGKNGTISIRFSRKSNIELNNLHIALGIDDEYGHRIAHFNNDATNQIFNNLTEEINTVEINIEKLPLRCGQYSFTLYSAINGEVADWIQEAGTFHVEVGDFFNTGKLPPDGQGNFYIGHSFKIK